MLLSKQQACMLGSTFNKLPVEIFKGVLNLNVTYKSF